MYDRVRYRLRCELNSDIEPRCRAITLRVCIVQTCRLRERLRERFRWIIDEPRHEIRRACWAERPA
jgi:hypothetical protein